MDATALRERIKATLDTNASTRKQAELELRHVHLTMPASLPLSLTILQAEEQPGFPDCLLDILETEREHGVRLSSAWDKNDSFCWAPLIVCSRHIPQKAR